MKKAYTKPELYFEDFMLSSNIAGTCGQFDFGKATSGDFNTCGFEFYGVGVVFNNGTCALTTQDSDFNSLCYFTASPEAIFNS